MKRYEYVKDKKDRIRLFWMGKTKRTKESVKKYMNGEVNWYDFYNIYGFDKTKNLCSCGTLWSIIKKLRELELIKKVN